MLKDILNQKYYTYDTIDEYRHLEEDEARLIARDMLHKENEILKEIVSRYIMKDSGYYRYLSPKDPKYVFDNGDYILDEKSDNANLLALEQIASMGQAYANGYGQDVVWGVEKDTLNGLFMLNIIHPTEDGISELNIPVYNSRITFKHEDTVLDVLLNKQVIAALSPKLSQYSIDMANVDKPIPLEEYIGTDLLYKLPVLQYSLYE